MENEKLPIKFFAKRKVDELRVEPGGNTETPNWVLSDEALEKRSTELIQAFEPLVDLASKRISHQSAIPYVFVAKINSDATAKSRRSDISSLFRYGDKDSIIGLTSTDGLVVKIESQTQIEEISTKLKDFKRNSYAISCLDTFLEFQPSIDFNYDNDVSYKVKLIDFQDYETNLSIQRLFEHFLISNKITYKKSNYIGQLPIYKINKAPQAILDVIGDDDVHNALFSIEPMPKYKVQLDFLHDDTNVDIIKPISGNRYETLGILDNGIAKIPHLAPWLSNERWTVYPDTEINPTHGTFVAGVALYGDMCEEKDWVGHHGIKLFDAAIFPNANESLDEDELIANIKEAIDANHEEIKVWNLSISVDRPVVDTKFSDLAIALDALQTKYNILICKSAGNCSNFLKGLPKGRINEGADSIRSLVVGSVAHKKSESDLSEIDNPSPFSRVGPGPEYIIKPEVVHYGGNAGIDANGQLAQTGVTSFSKDGVLSKAVGTSFSTPRISALATGLYQDLDEDFDPLLLKGLIIHSATYSEKLLIPETERAKQLGFGVPKNIPQILYNDPYEATLILRDTLEKGQKIDIMDFPMPKSLIRNGYYTGQIVATLVYDPILDSSQGVEYCQSNLDIKFGSYDRKKARDTSRKTILNPVGRDGAKNLLLGGLYSKRLMRENKSEFALQERLLIQYADKYYPVKKYAIDLSELSEANKHNFLTADKQWYLFIEGLFREHTEQRARLERTTLSQDFCLIITIRDPERKANVYDDITQGLDEYNFWHSNIKLSSDVIITVDKNE